MSRPSNVRKPTATELRRVHLRLEKPLLPWQRRRAEVILLHAADQSATRIAQLLQVHPNTVYADLHAFAQRRLSCLNGPRTVGAPPRLSREQVETIWHLAEKPPTAVGLPYGRWSLAKLRAYLIRQRLVKAISREHLRRVLKKGDTDCATSGARSSAPTPIDP